LYNLYETVSKTITAFKERAWSDVVRADLEEMEETATKYGDACSRLPKDLKEWAAYKDLKNQIESLKEVLPIIIDLKKPSIQPRHWIKIQEITGKTLNYEYNKINNYEKNINFFIKKIKKVNQKTSTLKISSMPIFWNIKKISSISQTLQINN
jgi:hypothetical protein